MIRKPQVIGKRQPGPPPATMPQVTPNPHRLNALLPGGAQNLKNHPRTNLSRILPVMNNTPIRIRIENTRKRKLPQSSNKPLSTIHPHSCQLP